MPAANVAKSRACIVETHKVLGRTIVEIAGNVASSTNGPMCGDDGSEGALIEGVRSSRGDMQTDLPPGGTDEAAALRPDHADEDNNDTHRHRPTTYPSPHPSTLDELSAPDEQHRRNVLTSSRRTQRPLSYKEPKMPRKGRVSVRKDPSRFISDSRITLLPSPGNQIIRRDRL